MSYPLNILSLMLVQCLLCVGVDRILGWTPLPTRWRYRAAFLLSGCAGLAYLAAGQPGRLPPAGNTAGLYSLLPLLAVLCGAFSGGLLATALRQTLWENNAPPEETLQAAVLRTHQEIIGIPGRTPVAKTIFDRLLAFLGLLLSAPVWLGIALLVWIEDPGPILFIKNSVGKGGKNFHQLKFRTMVCEAERDTGPVLAQENDERLLVIGRLLRKTALDELPQLINILLGEMSFVGPRPQRTILVYEYLQNMPEYAGRHRIQPGLAGLAQVAGDYYITPRQKLRLDRLYIQHAGLGFDLKLLLLAFLLTFYYRWKKDWNGRLPRSLL
jgi:lipopolysaccharide/colanic/teichoic acid biosynthesis glycosyltransferase